ncbi:MAG: YigZ family protein [Clostridiales bacterium]|nr:YigZ family protein [Clostridiales bacterium]
MILYKSVMRYGEAEIVIEKSRFIAHVMPIEKYEEGQTFISRIKTEYKDATHNVPVIICGPKQEYQWASDDGEPSGTSGLPMLKVLVEEGLTNLALVVTRYFGGVKLGTGGLSRAYTSLAKAGIEAADICGVVNSAIMYYNMDYTFLPKLQNMTKDSNFDIVEIVYTDKVSVSLECLDEDSEEIASMMMNLTSGTAEFVSIEKNKKKLKI